MSEDFNRQRPFEQILRFAATRTENRIDTRRSYQVIEAIVLELLAVQAKSENKSLNFPSGRPGISSRYEFDATLPDGLVELPGATAVEIRVSYGPKNFPRILDEFFSRALFRAKNLEHISNVLLIFTGAVGSRSRAQFEQMSQNFPEGPRLVLWDIKRIEELAQAHPEVLDRAKAQLSVLPLEQEFREPPVDWRQRSRTQLSRLRETYSKEGLTLVLGAGVSSSAGLPSWEALLGNLYVAAVAAELKNEFIDDNDLLPLAAAAQELNGPSPLLNGRYLRKGMSEASDGADFVRRVAKGLYSSLTDEDTTSPLLSGIARLAQPERTGAKVKAIITYNFDDLLERALENAAVRFRPVSDGSTYVSANELPIFHVHGYLPREVLQDPSQDQELPDITFSEEGYHALFRDPFHWSNVIQITEFRQTTCLLLGLSLTDPNLRRLLEFAQEGSDKPRHATFKKRHSLDELNAALPADTNVSREAREIFLRTHHSLEERVLQELGVETIWFDSFEDIAAAVNALK